MPYVAWPILRACPSPYIFYIVQRPRRHLVLSGQREGCHQHRKESVVLGRQSSEKHGPIFCFELPRGDAPA